MSSGASDKLVQLTARVRGRVQGVGYRFFAQRVAVSLGLRGYVRNLPGGEVEIVAQGPREALEAFLRRLWEGPYGARVDDVAARWETADAGGIFGGFAIRH